MANTYCKRKKQPNKLVLPKNNACPENNPLIGNPCNVATGNKFQSETDYQAPNFGGLQFSRFYNSSTGSWTHSYSRFIAWKNSPPGVSGGIATAHRDNGVQLTFVQQEDKTFRGDSDVNHRLTVKYIDNIISGWDLLTEQGATEVYDANGRLVSIKPQGGVKLIIAYTGKSITVTDEFGHAIYIKKNDAGTLEALTDSGMRVYSYSYDALGNIESVLYPDGNRKLYHYNEAMNTGGGNLAHALTGISDENGNRFATYKYDDRQRVIVSEHDNGVGRVAIKYLGETGENFDSSSEVTDALGAVHTFSFGVVNGVAKNLGGNNHCSGCNTSALENNYDDAGNLISSIGQNSERTEYTYDDRNLEISRIEAVGTPEERIIKTSWHPVFRKKTETIEGNKVTRLNYESENGNISSYSVSDAATGAAQSWSYKYNKYGQIIEIDGPREDVSDIMTLTYDDKGNLLTVKNALGHLTRYTSYDIEGRPLLLTDPNGLITKLSYDIRGRLAEKTVGQELTKFTYDNVGLLLSIKIPSGEEIYYVYDNAHRLTDIKNSAGERIHYDLDAKDNVIKEVFLTSSGETTFAKEKVFDEYSRLHKLVNSTGKAIVYDADPGGNVHTVTDQLLRQTFYSFDSLNRVREVIFSDDSVVKQDFDGNDQLIKVVNPKEVPVEYTMSALGEVKATSSYDADTFSATRDFDSAGNLISKSDNRGVVTKYSYDVLNRIKTISASDAVSITFNYDAGDNGKGRLSSFTDESGTTSRTYNVQGRLETVGRTFNGLSAKVGYKYDVEGRIKGITYPSGRVITYHYDKEKIIGIDVGSNVLIKDIKYYPFSRVRSWRWGNEKQYFRTMDLDGNIASYSFGDVIRNLARDDGGNIISVSDSSNIFLSQKFSYDNINRLVDYYLGASSVPVEHYEYDLNGNRISADINGKSYKYEYDGDADTLLSVSGPIPKTWTSLESILHDSAHIFKIDSYRRISSATSGSTRFDYLYDGLQRRVTKRSNDGSATHYIFDDDGRLLAELDKAGNSLVEHIWLGSQPVGVVNNGIAHYVFADHIDTPRLITDTTGRARWLWQSGPFGDAPPNENPGGLGVLNYNLRFPGQYYDKESGLHYNYFRYYDPQIGRYVQSDLIGLAGGINTYVYATNNPLTFSDPSGLVPNPAELACLGGPNPICVGGVALDFGSWLLAGVGTTATIAAMVTPGDSAKPAASVEEFCSNCKATLSRSQAQAQAWAWAGITPGGTGITTRPWKPDFNPPGGSSFFKSRVWASFNQQYPGSYFGYDTISGSVEEHAFGYPDMPGGLNHDCPHFLARNSKGIPKEFAYKPGSI